MLAEFTERTANTWADITEDPAIKKVMAGETKGTFLEILMELFEKLMPLLLDCLPTGGRMTPEQLISRADAWEEVVYLTRWQRRRELGFIEALLMGRWERRVGRVIDRDAEDEFDNGEVCAAMLHTFANAEPSEVKELRAEGARLMDDAA